MNYWLNKKLYKLPWYLYIPLTNLILVSIGICSNLIYILIANKTIALENPFLKQYTFWQTILLVVVLGPIIETFLLQSSIFNILLFFKQGQYINILKKKFNLSYLIFSALLFGLLHVYSVVYIITMTFMGYIFAYTYLLYKKKKQYAFWIVTIIHAIHNLIGVTAIYLDK